MSKSTFRINKVCEQCGSLFESQKTTTRFCSHKCNQRNYKLRKKLEKKKTVEVETLLNKGVAKAIILTAQIYAQTNLVYI